jgi:sulfur transfer complex TusBCD TusB component (DsrH family)
VDGQLVCISLLKQSNRVFWCITSQQKSILATNAKDVSAYRGNDFKDIKEIAKTWFSILEDLRKRNIRDKDFQNSIKDKTLVGKFVGARDSSKVMLSNSKNIIFQFIVKDKLQDGYICELPEVTVKFFKKWTLNVAPWSRIGFYDDIYSLFDALYADYQSLITSKALFDKLIES